MLKKKQFVIVFSLLSCIVFGSIFEAEANYQTKDYDLFSSRAKRLQTSTPPPHPPPPPPPPPPVFQIHSFCYLHLQGSVAQKKNYCKLLKCNLINQ